MIKRRSHANRGRRNIDVRITINVHWCATLTIAEDGHAACSGRREKNMYTPTPIADSELLAM